jgi:putative ABC transport system permease protein
MRAHDLTVGIRNLIRRPAFAATAILLLALGAGANAAVFSVVRGILLKPLAYHEPERLVSFWPNTFVSNEEIVYWRARTHSFEEIAVISPGWLMALVVDGLEPLKVTGGRTSDDFFKTLGVQARIGRTLLPGDSTPGKTRVVVISSPLYEQHFQRDPRIIGRPVTLDGAPHEIIGVMPPGFEFVEPGTDVWAPIAFDPSSPQFRATFGLAVARLRQSVPIEVASTELQSLVPAMRTDLKKAVEWGRDIHVASLQETVVADVRPTLLILLAAVGLILLLAAVNLGTLVLGRSIERAREMAVRTALGASRVRLVRQLIAEQLVLAATGALVGLLLARVSLPLLVSRIPPEIPRQSDIALDATVFISVFAISVLVALLLALVPVIIAARPELQPLLRQNQSTETPARRRALGTLVAAQVALAIVLGIGAGLMLRSVWNLQQVDPGFTAPGVLGFRLQTTSKYNNLAKGLPYLEQVVERLRALPGVTHVGSIQHLPMTGYNWTAQVYRVEAPPAPGTTPPSTIWRFIGWDYFQTLGITLRTGRTFTAQDDGRAPAVAIVNEAFARREFGDAAAAIGRRVVTTSAAGQVNCEIVGVINDVRFLSLDKPATPEMYRPLAQTFMFPMAVVVRTSGDPAQLAAAVRQAVYSVDPTIPIAEMQPLPSLIASSLGRPRLLAVLLSVFAAAGLALGVVGVYGVVAYRVRQRQREFGIRLALGAAPRRIARTVVTQGIGYAVAGLVIGLPAAFALTRLMQTVIFGITAHDPVTFIALPVTITVATLLACLLPAWRAARVDPVTTMRGD